MPLLQDSFLIGSVLQKQPMEKQYFTTFTRYKLHQYLKTILALTSARWPRYSFYQYTGLSIFIPAWSNSTSMYGKVQKVMNEKSCNSTLLNRAHVIAATINELLGNKQLFQLDWITICPNQAYHSAPHSNKSSFNQSKRIECM